MRANEHIIETGNLMKSILDYRMSSDEQTANLDIATHRQHVEHKHEQAQAFDKVAVCKRQLLLINFNSVQTQSNQDSSIAHAFFTATTA